MAEPELGCLPTPQRAAWVLTVLRKPDQQPWWGVLFRVAAAGIPDHAGLLPAPGRSVRLTRQLRRVSDVHHICVSFTPTCDTTEAFTTSCLPGEFVRRPPLAPQAPHTRLLQEESHRAENHLSPLGRGARPAWPHRSQGLNAGVDVNGGTRRGIIAACPVDAGDTVASQVQGCTVANLLSFTMLSGVSCRGNRL